MEVEVDKGDLGAVAAEGDGQVGREERLAAATLELNTVTIRPGLRPSPGSVGAPPLPRRPRRVLAISSARPAAPRTAFSSLAEERTSLIPTRSAWRISSPDS